MKVFQVRICHRCSLWQYILIDNLVAMETLLPWQQVNCAITQLYMSILSPYEAHMFLETRCITGSPSCHGNHSNHGSKRMLQ